MKRIKILGISSSLSTGSNTSILVNEALKGASMIEGVEVKFISLQKKEIKQCIICRYCTAKEPYCVLKDDMREIYKAILWANGMIWGTPVYNQTLNAQMKTIMERCKPLERFGLFRFKIGAAIAVGGDRNVGQEFAIHAIQTFFISNMMLTVGGIHTAVGVSGVAYKEKTINRDIFPQETYGRINTKENAILLGKFLATWTKVFNEGFSIINPATIFSCNNNLG